MYVGYHHIMRLLESGAKDKLPNGKEVSVVRWLPVQKRRDKARKAAGSQSRSKFSSGKDLENQAVDQPVVAALDLVASSDTLVAPAPPSPTSSSEVTTAVEVPAVSSLSAATKFPFSRRHKRRSRSVAAQSNLPN